MLKADREDEEEFNEHGAKRQNSSHQRSVAQQTWHTRAATPPHLQTTTGSSC